MTDARQVLSHGSCYLVEMSPPGTFQQYCRAVERFGTGYAAQPQLRKAHGENSSSPWPKR
jgi:hypothetical protein